LASKTTELPLPLPRRLLAVLESIPAFHLNATCCFTKNTRNTLHVKMSPGCSWTTFTVKTMDSMHQSGPKWGTYHPAFQYVILTLDVY